MAKTRSTKRRRRPVVDSRRRKRIVYRFSENDFVDYKDVALLRKFMSDRGKIRSRRKTAAVAFSEEPPTAEGSDRRERPGWRAPRWTRRAAGPTGRPW